jgi:23S rRNA (uracil1939-C5)-methyltransferase
VLPVTECRVAAPLLWRAATELLQLTEELQQANALLRSCNEIELFCDAEGTQVQASLFLAAAERDLVAVFQEMCAAWQQTAPQLTGAGLYAPQGTARKREEPAMRQVTNWGTGTLTYAVGGLQYRVTRGAFFQVNRHRIAELLQLVTQGRKGALAWDLYAGAGLFSCALASSFEQVVAVEIASPANKDLAHNLAQTSRATAHTVVAATTLEFLTGQAKSKHRQRPQLVVLDPPRAGLGAEVCRLLAQAEAPQLVYVSCDPATLARDLAALVESGYQLQQVHLVDLFPQTFHLETVVTLTRR